MLLNSIAVDITNVLHRIHKILLYPVEDHDSNGEKHAHEDKAVDQPAPARESTAAEESVFECFDDWSDWVETHEFVDRYAIPEHTLSLA